MSELDRLIKEIDLRLSQDIKTIISVDGRAAAGKTSLSEFLCDKYECNIYHTDDFFLTPDMRTAQRLNEAGGNVDRERFLKEVVNNILIEKDVIYTRFSCKTLTFEESKIISPKKLEIIEGAYSNHPYFNNPYHIRVFCDVDKNEQEKRILNRNGEKALEVFKAKWIPMEEKYINTFDIESKMDFVLKIGNKDFLK